MDIPGTCCRIDGEAVFDKAACCRASSTINANASAPICTCCTCCGIDGEAAVDGCTIGALDGSSGDAFAAAALKGGCCCTLAPDSEDAAEDGAEAATDLCKEEGKSAFKLCCGLDGGAGSGAAFDLCKEGKIEFKLLCCLDGGPDDDAVLRELDIPVEEFNEGGGGRLLIVILLFNIYIVKYYFIYI